MSKKSMRAKAIQAINDRGVLLVYPLQNRAEPRSLWGELYPRTKMRWEWDEDGDSRVADLWHLRAQLSLSREVVYAKWYQNRATFFSFEVCTWMIAYMRDMPLTNAESKRIFEILEMDSPLSTKMIKEASELQGKFFESSYEKAMRELWKRLWVVGFGEVEDSSFPSLAVGATRLIFEDLWNESQGISAAVAERELQRKLGDKNPFWQFARKIRAGARPRSGKSSSPGKMPKTPSGGVSRLSRES